MPPTPQKPPKKPLTREEIASILEQIALLLELQGENPFKIRAYRTGAETVRSHPEDLLRLARERQLTEIKGLGKALQDKLHELATTGGLAFYETLRGQFPESLFELFELPGLGPKKIKVLYDSLEIDSLAALQAACQAGKLAPLKGFGKKTEEKILAALTYHSSNASRFLIDQAAAVASELRAWLRAHPEVSQLEVAGSLRRSKETVHDLDFLVAAPEGNQLTRDFAEADFAQEVLACGETKASIRHRSGLPCDLRVVRNEHFPFALQYFTGSKEHNVALRQRALQRGYSLNEYRLEPTQGAPQPSGIETEEQLYRFLELDWIDPALRENQGEIEAAEQGALPSLVTWTQLRGTFHNHTTESDGTATLADMAEAAIDLGLQYLGIADHSKSSFQANGLDETRLLQQIESVRDLNQSYAEQGVDFRLFSGSEVDILKDGRLDFDDELLAQLDYVVASVHSAFSLPEEEMSARLLRAIENPHVTMLGHLTGRLLLKREPYALDIPKILEACARTGTVIELNAHARRLDLDWRWWKRAKEKGILCSINPDAHSPSGLQHLRHGAEVARKGWLTKADVLNTRTRPQIERFLQTGKPRASKS
ncbi:MAG: DNA polymerase/3'-5' exonuclease PolX [Verrucomicrobiota bacterium]